MREKLTLPKASLYLAVLLTSFICLISVFGNRASATGGSGGNYVVTIYSCGHWTCTGGGTVSCPGIGWTPPGC